MRAIKQFHESQQNSIIAYVKAMPTVRPCVASGKSAEKLEYIGAITVGLVHVCISTISFLLALILAWLQIGLTFLLLALVVTLSYVTEAIGKTITQIRSNLRATSTWT